MSDLVSDIEISVCPSNVTLLIAKALHVVCIPYQRMVLRSRSGLMSYLLFNIEKSELRTLDCVGLIAPEILQ